MRRLRLAVIGGGHLGRIHARQLARRPEVELAAVVDPVAEVRQALAAELGCPALADPRDLDATVDAAIVATPTRNHTEVALEQLAAGRHLFVEKPLAATAADAARLVRAARQAQRVLQVGHVERFHPAWTAALPHLAEARFIQASRLGGFKFRSLDIGVVLDLMIHDLDLVLSIVRSPVVSVEALGLALFGGPEDVAHARVVFANGCVALLAASRASRAAERKMQVGTPRGFVTVDFAARTAEVLRPSLEVVRGQLDAEGLAPAERQTQLDTWLDTHLAQQSLPVAECDQIAAEHDDFLDSIRRARQPKVSGEDALAALELAEEVLAQLRAHAWDGQPEGRVGPRALPGRRVVPAPHFGRRRAAAPPAEERREAG